MNAIAQAFFVSLFVFAGFWAYAVSAVVYGAPLLFVLWLFGALS